LPTQSQPQGQPQPQGQGNAGRQNPQRQNNQANQTSANNTQQSPPRQEWNRGGEADAANRNSRRRRRGRDRGLDRELAVQERMADQPFTGDPVDVEGFLDLRDEGFGFVRTAGFLASPKDVYVSVSQARRFGLRRGDFLVGAARPAAAGEKFPALLRIDTVSGMTPEDARNRPRFEDLTPLFPDQKLKMETPGDSGNITARIVDLLCPIGKGQRGLIVSPPKAGKTTVIKQIAHSIETNNPDVHLIVLLVDERPEEVTDMRRTVKGEVIASTFDRPSDEHTQVAELALERAKRLVEEGRDVVIILDGITRLTRAYNLSAPASGRLTSGGIDQAAIYPPKKFFGAARNAEEGGSLTILATALVETGSKADDVIFEELKGTGNMELRLDRRLAERRLYPAIDVNASSTRHEELLFERGTLQLVWRLRRVLNGLGDDGGSSWKALELLMDKIKSTKSNDEFLAEVSKTQTPV
jgi:transcription termination factor Rho